MYKSETSSSWYQIINCSRAITNYYQLKAQKIKQHLSYVTILLGQSVIWKNKRDIASSLLGRTLYIDEVPQESQVIKHNTQERAGNVPNHNIGDNVIRSSRTS